MAANAKDRNNDSQIKLAIIVQQGKVLDFIDGKTQRPETPEEYVRQEIAKSLVREYRYDKVDIEVEFIVRVGSRKPRADLVIFPPSTAHTQDKAVIIVECKASTVKSADKKDGVGQLQSYMAACPNVTYGMWTNGVERFCYRRVVKDGSVNIEDVPDLPEFGQAMKRKTAHVLTSLSLPHLMPCSLRSGAATTTLPVIRDSRSHKHSGNYSS
jgi:type I restriction enzyme M protein